MIQLDSCMQSQRLKPPTGHGKKTPLAKLRMLYARSLGCTWNKPYSLQPKRTRAADLHNPLIWDVSKMVPADPRFDERGFFIQRINKDFSQFSQKNTHQLPDFSTSLSQNPSKPPWHQHFFASPRLTNCLGINCSGLRCSSCTAQRSGRAPGVHHGPMVAMDLDETVRIWGKFGGFQ